MLDAVITKGEQKFTETQYAALRAFLRRKIRTEFGNDQGRAAEAYGVSDGYLSEVLSGKRNGGLKLLRGIGRHHNQPIDAAIGGVSARVVYVDRYPRFSNSPGWAEALAEARAERPKVPEQAWLAAGETSALLLERVTADQVIRFAQAWLDSGPAARLEQLEAEAARRDRVLFEARVAEAERLHQEQAAAGGEVEEVDAIHARLRDLNWQPTAPELPTTNDAPPPPANDTPKKKRAKK